MSTKNCTIRADIAGQDVGHSALPRDRGALSGPLTGLSFVAGVASAVALADDPYPRPGSESADVRRYFTGNPGAARISAAGQSISAALLARFTASVAGLAARSGRGSRGLRAAAIAGGPVHGVGFGLLVGSLGLAGLRTGELPRPLAIAGMVSAVTGLLSPLYFVARPAAWFIPAGRFSGLLVGGLAGARLGRRAG